MKILFFILFYFCLKVSKVIKLQHKHQIPWMWREKMTLDAGRNLDFYLFIFFGDSQDNKSK